MTDWFWMLQTHDSIWRCLIPDIGQSKLLDEVANGNNVKAPKKGTTFICIVEVISNETFDIPLEDVFCVPGLSRILFSVTQWTYSRGSLSFHGTTCKIAYKDANNPATHESISAIQSYIYQPGLSKIHLKCTNERYRFKQDKNLYTPHTIFEAHFYTW